MSYLIRKSLLPSISTVQISSLNMIDRYCFLTRYRLLTIHHSMSYSFTFPALQEYKNLTHFKTRANYHVELLKNVSRREASRTKMVLISITAWRANLISGTDKRLPQNAVCRANGLGLGECR